MNVGIPGFKRMILPYTIIEKGRIMRLKPGIPTFIAASFWLFSGCGGEKPAPPRPAAAPQEQVQTPASVSCKILLEGTPPKMESVKMNADRKCTTMHKE